MSTLMLLAMQTPFSPKAAKDAADAVDAAASHNWLSIPDHWPSQTELLSMCSQIGPGLATLMVLLGIVYLMFGFNMFKSLIIINAAAFGAMAGYAIGEHTGGSLPLAVTCGFIMAVVTFPMMKSAIAMTGILYGAIIGMSTWQTVGLDPHFAWAGAGMGLIFFGLLTFILFRTCVMTFMSLQGAAMVIFGLIALSFKYEGLPVEMRHILHSKPFLLPMVVFIPTVLGVVYQQSHATAPPPPAKK